MFQAIFGRPLKPDELARKWRQNLKAQERVLDRQLRGIQMEEMKVKKSLKEAAKKGDKKVCRMLAKEIIHSRKATTRIHTSKAQLNSIGMQLQQTMAQLKVAGTLNKSTEIMKAVNRLVKLPEIGQQMQEMSREMMKAGVIEEMMEDSMDAVLDDDGVEEEAEEEVEKVLVELTSGLLEGGGSVGASLPQTEDTVEIADGGEMDEMKARLDLLKS